MPKENKFTLTGQGGSLQKAEFVQLNRDIEAKKIHIPFFSMIRGSTISQLPPAEVLPVLSSFTSGDMIDWTSIDPASQFYDIMTKTGSTLNRALSTVIDNPGDIKEDAYSLLREDLSRFDPDRILKTPGMPREWLTKVALGAYLYPAIKLSEGLFNEESSPQAKLYLSEVEKQLEAGAAALDTVTLDDLTAYLELSEAHMFVGYGLAEKAQSLAQKIPEGMKKMFNVSNADVAGELQDIQEGDMTLRQYNTAYTNAWERLRLGWSWKEVRIMLQALNTYPTVLFQSEGHIALLENVVAGLSQRDNDLNFDLSKEEIELVVTMMRTKSTVPKNHTALYDKSIANQHAFLKKEIIIDNRPIPYSRLPAYAFLMISEYIRSYGPVKSVDLLTQMGSIIKEKSAEDLAAWLLLLKMLGSAHPDLTETADELTAASQIPDFYRQVLQNKAPGKLWIHLDAYKLRRTDPSTVLASAVAFHTSTMTDKEADGVIINQGVQPDKEAAHFLETTRLQELPVGKNVGILTTKGTAAFLLGQEPHAQTEEIFRTFSMLQAHRLQKPRETRGIYYIPELLAPDSSMPHIIIPGIEAVYMQGDRFIFILTMSSHRENNTQAAFEGILTPSGYLKIPGIDEASIDKSVFLSLNNLALQISTNTYREYAKVIPNTWNVYEPEVHETLREWNTTRAKTQPYIDTHGEADIVGIPVYLPSHSGIYLFSGEMQDAHRSGAIPAFVVMEPLTDSLLVTAGFSTLPLHIQAAKETGLWDKLTTGEKALLQKYSEQVTDGKTSPDNNQVIFKRNLSVKEDALQEVVLKLLDTSPYANEIREFDTSAETQVQPPAEKVVSYKEEESKEEEVVIVPEKDIRYRIHIPLDDPRLNRDFKKLPESARSDVLHAVAEYNEKGGGIGSLKLIYITKEKLYTLRVSTGPRGGVRLGMIRGEAEEHVKNFVVTRAKYRKNIKNRGLSWF